MTVARLTVETEDLVTASRRMYGHVAEPLYSGVIAAVSDAAAQIGMAGDDPPGRQWASAYERAARVAVQAAQDTVNGCYQLAVLFAATADNYERADRASTAADRGAAAATTARLTPPTVVHFPADFSGAGGGASNAPFGWSLVQAAVGYAWPNGHQDGLRAAAAAWHRSAACLAGHAYDASLADIDVLVDRLPEAGDMATACTSMCTHLEQVAAAHRGLGNACTGLAHHLDVAHSKIEHELVVFLAESAAIQTAGAVVGAFTLGLGEGAAQGEQATRVAATVARITGWLEDFTAAVGELTLAIPGAAEVSARVSAAVHELLSIRIVSVEVAGVPGLRVLQVARDGSRISAVEMTGEAAAVGNLSESANLPAELLAASESPRIGAWNDLATLDDHFIRHAKKFGLISEQQYVREAGDFYQQGVREHLLIKIDKENQTIRVFNPDTQTFGSYTFDGAVRTYFRGTSKTFWSKQPGSEVAW